ncbi:hypothetical protein C5Y96_20920 [Blastopirellula marina]|uniref:HPt domain-containing protein n=1 Tax=Blastopirellula marina TaxID=124 RepID=A0A2S8F1A7_9BACT|nr:MULTISPECIES: Hpt domain-containing protein [Pirellulaceae]PQO25920.1 hypothetical protein C5Y96_20920 [Blastopirellula marina]RCS44278.1 Hpt domain-containing protein [Bremerella cremea]
MNPTQNSLPDLRKLNQRLALNSVRVQAFLDGLTPRLDQLLQAVSEGNMAEVGRTSHFIHRCCDVYGYEELAEKAGEVCQAAAACESVDIVGRKVVRLIGAFGRTSEDTNTTIAM